jgi:LytS/YehU family sensor histidine kinase
MVHPLQVRMLSQVIIYSLIIFLLLAIPVFKPLMQALDNPALSWQERAVVANDLLNLHSRFWPCG